MRPAAARAGAVLDKLSSWLPPPLRQREWQRLAYEIVLEVAIVVVFLKAYNGVRNLFGSQKCTPQFALGHALQVIKVERAFGIFWEQEIQVRVVAPPGAAASGQPLSCRSAARGGSGKAGAQINPRSAQAATTPPLLQHCAS